MNDPDDMPSPTSLFRNVPAGPIEPSVMFWANHELGAAKLERWDAKQQAWVDMADEQVENAELGRLIAQLPPQHFLYHTSGDQWLIAKWQGCDARDEHGNEAAWAVVAGTYNNTALEALRAFAQAQQQGA